MSWVAKRHLLILGSRVAYQAIETFEVDRLVIVIDCPDPLAGDDLLALVVGLISEFQYNLGLGTTHNCFQICTDIYHRVTNDLV